MSVMLSPATEKLIRELVENGRYPSADEAVQEGLRLIDVRERHLARLRADVDVGLEQLERGEGVELTEERMEQIFERALENSRAGKPIKDAVTP
jgi:antitoxin ParD1/3/4